MLSALTERRTTWVRCSGRSSRFCCCGCLRRIANAPTIREYQRVFLFASVPVVLGLLVIVFFVREKQLGEHHDCRAGEPQLEGL